MWRLWMKVMRMVDASWYKRRIERSLALHLRGEVRRDGLKLRKLRTRVEIEWYARDIHPWDRVNSPEQWPQIYVRQSLADTDDAITRLFQELPEIDTVALTVLEQNSRAVIMAGTVYRFAAEPDVRLSVGMRLRQRGIEYHSDGFRFQPLEQPNSSVSSILSQ